MRTRLGIARRAAVWLSACCLRGRLEERIGKKKWGHSPISSKWGQTSSGCENTSASDERSDPICPRSGKLGNVPISSSRCSRRPDCSANRLRATPPLWNVVWKFRPHLKRASPNPGRTRKWAEKGNGGALAGEREGGPARSRGRRAGSVSADVIPRGSRPTSQRSRSGCVRQCAASREGTPKVSSAGRNF